MALSLLFLGTPQIDRDGRPVTTDTRKAIALLAYLAVSRDHHTREALAALLWPEMDDERARAALRRTLSAVRSLIGEESLFANRETVALVEAPGLSADLWAFEEALATVTRHHRLGDELCPECLAILREAVSLYRDDFLQGFSLRDSVEFDDWHAGQAERLRRSLSGALSQLVEGHSRLGHYDEAIAYARRWLALDPLREDAHRRLMQLYAWNGARDLALRQYRDALRVLDAELGVDPLPETTDLYEAIQEGRLATPAPSPQPPAPSPQSPIPSPQPPVLIGREAAWQQLVAAHEQSRERGQVAMIVGEPGIGKSRLAEAFLEQTHHDGATTATAAWYVGEANLAYAPFAAALRALASAPDRRARLADLPAAWLAEAARLAPELQSLTGLAALPPDVSGPGAQARFFAAISEVLCALLMGPSPGILFLDDAQWADEASLELLAYFTRRLRELPITLILAWTDDAVSSDHRLRRLMVETQRTGNGHVIHLARWQPEDVAALVAAGGRPGLPPTLSERLYRETEGLPYFVVEYLGALASQPADHWLMPQTVRDLLAGRLATVDQTARQLLQTAAVIGRSFDYDRLWSASGRSEDEVVAGLDRLLEHGLIREAPGSELRELRYDFSHQQLRSVVYDDIHLARRRLLHRRVAAALVAQARGAPAGSLAGQIGYHYRLAGQDDVAADYYFEAGTYARSLYANREALEHFQTALALGQPDAAALHEAIGNLHTLLGEYNAALHAYESAAALTTGLALADLEHKLGQVYERRGDWELADSHLCAALALSEMAAAPANALITVDRSRVAHRSGDQIAAAELATDALAQAQNSGDSLAQALAHNALGILARQRGELAAARNHLEQSLALSAETGSPSARVAALNNLARLWAESDQPATAFELLDQALALCRQEGDRHHEAALLNHRADVLHQSGREDDAMTSLKEAVAIYAEIGLEAGGWQPEIWKLTEW